jgi:type III pantothenate kinase
MAARPSSLTLAHPPTLTSFRTTAHMWAAPLPQDSKSPRRLFAHTAQLPRVPLEPPATAIGTNTVASLQSGILFGYAGLIDGLVGRIQRELKARAMVIATGGLARTVAPCTECVNHVDLDLTLTGLRILYSRNAGAT